MNVENVEKLLEETYEAREYQKATKCLSIQNYCTYRLPMQEIDEMLSNNLTLDEEESVQVELKKLQEDVVRDFTSWPFNCLPSPSRLKEQNQRAKLNSPQCLHRSQYYQVKFLDL
jgi:hypothetical protein